jgi:hypothetical protein
MWVLIVVPLCVIVAFALGTLWRPADRRRPDQ